MSMVTNIGITIFLSTEIDPWVPVHEQQTTSSPTTTAWLIMTITLHTEASSTSYKLYGRENSPTRKVYSTHFILVRRIVFCLHAGQHSHAAQANQLMALALKKPVNPFSIMHASMHTACRPCLRTAEVLKVKSRIAQGVFMLDWPLWKGRLKAFQPWLLRKLFIPSIASQLTCFKEICECVYPFFLRRIPTKLPFSFLLLPPVKNAAFVESTAV